MKTQVSQLVLLAAIFVFAALAADSSEDCGIPRIRHQALIVKGSSTKSGEWPWHAAVFHRTGQRTNYACGGTLISKEFVISAAHCAIDGDTGYVLNRRRIFVRLGVHNLDHIDPLAMQQHSVHAIHIFSNFSKNDLRNDIAILELGEVAQLTDYVVPVCVNGMIDLTGEMGTTVGWGVTEDDELSPALKKASMPVIDSVDCLESDRDFFGTMLHKGVFCAGYRNGTSVCNGDSGSGLFFQRGGVWFFGGIVSFNQLRDHGTNLCFTDGYAAFTNVARYLPWMRSITGLEFKIPSERTTVKPVAPKRARVPYTPRVSDKKCYEYLHSRGSMQYDDGSQATIRDLTVNGPQTCLANIISERFLLSAGSCAHGKFNKVSLTATLYGRGYDFKISNLKMMLHPNFTGKEYVDRSTVVLIDLGRNYNELKPGIACLWTDPNEITLDTVSGAWWPTELGHPAQPLSVIESADGLTLTTNDHISCDDDRTILGIRLSLRKQGEHFYRMAGPLIHCESSQYARLTPYLDWIESVVWPGEKP